MNAPIPSPEIALSLTRILGELRAIRPEVYDVRFVGAEEKTASVKLAVCFKLPHARRAYVITCCSEDILVNAPAIIAAQYAADTVLHYLKHPELIGPAGPS